MDIKLYLFPQDTDVSVKNRNQSELRIIHEFETDYSTYKQFIKRLEILFEEALDPTDELKTYWLDEENELVCFSSTEELHCAFKLYDVYKKARKPQDPYFLKVFIKRSSKYFRI